MFNVGGGELFAIMLLALLILGPERLPKAMAQVGRWVGQLRRMSNGFQDEIRRAMDPDNAPFRPGEQTLRGPAGTPQDEIRVINTSAEEGSATGREQGSPRTADPEPGGATGGTGTDDGDDLRAAG